ncbi:MAG TPA: cytochrome c oxidase subunit II [Tepidisphaeraceae bacterium]|nr:cytochrome c oxidase subunit II [Tepidisphaeraceae bacterium]
MNGPFPRIRKGPTIGAALAVLGAAPAAFAQVNKRFEWSDWWLPPNYSAHGGAIDALFITIFWITLIVLVIVQASLIIFLIRYRHSAKRAKGHFIHGNTRVEMAWTLAPSVILAVLALASKGVWHNYRYNESEKDERTQIMVIGEQFKWNVVFAGPDGKVGKYLQFPKLSDPKFRTLDSRRARQKINDYISDENPLGKPANEKDDPYGLDDDWDKVPGRPVVIPYDRPIDVVLGSKDVLHDFFLPNFRVKLDAVPGMLGHIYFRAKKQSTVDTPIDNVALDVRLWIDRDTPGAKPGGENGAYLLADPRNANGLPINTSQTLERLARARLEAQNVANPSAQQVEEAGKQLKADLKAAGVSHIFTYVPFEVVCEELCGQGHATMRGELIVVSPRQYTNFIYKNEPPATQPARTIASSN